MSIEPVNRSLKRRRLSCFIALCSGSASIGFVVLAYRANEVRWRQGPVVLPLSSTHGLHQMDVLLLTAAGASGALSLIAAMIAKR
jgi:multisubunit Na+/H+ antiporter MnhB subunit